VLSGLIAALRNLIKRVVADWVILTSALVTSLLSMILLTAGPIYADAVSLSALQKTIEDAPPIEAMVQLEARVPAALFDEADGIVSGSVDETFRKLGYRTTTQISSDSFELVEAGDDELIALTVFQSLEEIEDHATLIDGAWPVPGGAQVAVSAAVAETLGVGVGDPVTTENRRDSDLAVTVEISGVFEVGDPTDVYWLDDRLMLEGMVESANFTTVGPLVTSEQSLLGQVAPLRASVNWRVAPDFKNLAVADVGTLRARIAALGGMLTEAAETLGPEFTRQTSDFGVKTQVGELLGDTSRSLTVTRSSVIGLLVQLAILAGYALVLTAGLLVESRATETYLVRSRGASPGQFLAVAVAEGVLLVLPAVIVAPWLATKALDLLNEVGPLAGINLSIEPIIPIEAYVVASIAAVGVIVAMAWPAYQAAVESHGLGRRRSRESSRFKTQRAGLDLALVAVAMLAFWQLQSLGPQLSARVQGRFGVDPLLVISPALGLLAGAVLALRIVPLLARVAESIAAAGRRAIPALSSWQVARRPVRYARSALLLIMAIGIGFFAAAYSSTWLDSQEDQAAHQVGADIRVSPNRRTGDSIGDLHLIAAQESIQGVEGSMAVVRKSTSVATSLNPVRMFLVDAARADVVALRSDLHEGFDEAAQRMTAKRPSLATVEFPGRPEQIGMVFEISEEEVFPTADGGMRGEEPLPLAFNALVRLVIQDGNGMLHRLPAGSISSNVGVQRVAADLATFLEDGTRATPRYPVSLVSIEISQPLPFPARSVRLELRSIETRERTGAWKRVDHDSSVAAWDVETRAVGGLVVDQAIAISPDQTEGSLTIGILTGEGGFEPAPVLYGIRPRGSEVPQVLPAIVSRSFLEENRSAVGDVVRFSGLSNASDQIVVEGVVDVFPTVDPASHETVLVDLPTYQAMSYELGSPLDAIDENWVGVAGDSDEVASILDGDVFDSFSLLTRQGRLESLANDPVALGTIGALALGFIAAAVFAAVGFAVSAAVSARERLTEFALLRAVGLTGRQLGVWLSSEQGVLVVLSLLFGTVVGFILTATILPLIAVTQSGDAPIPGVIVAYPWSIILTLEVVVLATLALIVLVMTLALRRMGLGSLLRLGED
jgi:hypothetical protein